jgi:hypothetical protein
MVRLRSLEGAREGRSATVLALPGTVWERARCSLRPAARHRLGAGRGAAWWQGSAGDGRAQREHKREPRAHALAAGERAPAAYLFERRERRTADESGSVGWSQDGKLGMGSGDF